MIMGIAVMTMATVLGEIFVITAVATAMKRQLISFSDLLPIVEMLASIVVAILTVVIAAASTGAKISEGGIAMSRYS